MVQAALASQVLVVPPFECAWLTGEDYLLRDGGCISFEVKGDNDVTVILKPQCGSRRWQHLASSPRRGAPAAPAPAAAATEVEPNYTVILGSHRNSCLKIEKDGELCHMACNVPGSKLSATAFTRFWVSFQRGALAVGAGDPGPATLCCAWTDADPIPGIQFVGLSAWDKHVGYRNIRLHPPVELVAESGGRGGGGAAGEVGEPLPTLVELCCREALRGLAPHSICAALTVADAIAPVVDGLRARAIEGAAAALPSLLREDPEGFEGLTAASLAEILAHQSLVCGEKALFDALVAWAGATDAVARGPQPPGAPGPSTPRARPLSDVEALLPHVRFPLMAPCELDAVEAHPLCALSPLLRELVAEARRGAHPPPGAAASVRADRLLRQPSPAEAAASARFQRRAPPGCTQLIYMYDGDHNGVCWHVGTRYGAQSWVNPAVAGLLRVSASSPVGRGTDPRALLSGAFLRTNFAGPRRGRGGELEAWWALDLGPGRALAANFYTLRADGSGDFLRSWALQGSNDGAEWVDLRRHESDRTFKLPGQYGSWPVAGGAAAAAAYRHFRVALLAPNQEAANPWRVSLSYLELYGNFFSDGGEGGPAGA